MSFHEAMLQDHLKLDTMLESLIDAARAGDRDELGRRWDIFESVLLAHVDAEEMFMLPALARHDPARAKAIHDEHAKIREVLATAALALDLHTMKEEHLVELRVKIEEHARSEEVDFYRWADEALPQTTLASIRRRLEKQLRGAVVKVASARWSHS